MPTAIFLIGLPGSGKSTLRELMRSGYFVASSDDFIEMVAKSEGKTYNDVFKANIKAATKHFDHMVSHAVASNTSVIVDKTNLSVDSRRRVLAKIPVSWKKVAVIMSIDNPYLWKERLRSRVGKTIPEDVLHGMAESFEEPSLAEGFDEILEYTTT